MKKDTTIPSDFLNTIIKTIADFDMLGHKESILVTVSGGPDSVALLLSLLAVQKEYDLKIGVAHLNHMLRGQESIRDEVFVKALAKSLQLPFHGEQKNIANYASRHGWSIEEAGREARYHFFDGEAKTHGYSKIATGHNKDDNAELVLINLLRGAGARGISGIPPVRDNKYIRPLIRTSKKEILDFLADRQQEFMVDSSNQNRVYLRNQIRCDLIPHLESRYNPEIKNALDRLSRVLRQEDHYLDKEAEKAFHKSVIKSEPSSIVFSKDRLSLLHPALLNRVFRKAIKKIKTDLKQITFDHINDIIQFCLNTPSGRSLDLPSRIRIYKDKKSIEIRKEKKPLREIGKKEKQLRQMGNKMQNKES